MDSKLSFRLPTICEIFFLFTDTHHLNKMEGDACLSNFENKRQSCIPKVQGCFFFLFWHEVYFFYIDLVVESSAVFSDNVLSG